MTTKTSERKYLTIGAGMIKYLDDLLEYVQPQPYIVSSTDYNGGDIPVLTANQSFILGYTDEKNGIFYASEKCPVIIFDDFTCDIKFVDFPFKVKSSALKILRSRTDPSTLKFVYEMMKLTIPLSNNHKRHWISETSHLAYAMPSTNDQVSISKLSTLIDKIMQSQRQEICLLRQILSTIYNYWFVQFDFPDKNGRPYKSSGGKMVYNEQLKQEIPEGWKIAKVKDIATVVLGGTPSRDNDAYWNGNISWLNSGEVAIFPIIESKEQITADGLNNSSAKLMPEKTIAISITGYIRVSVLGVPACANQSVVGIVDDKYKIGETYLLNAITNLVPYFNSKQTGNSQKHINKDIVGESLIVLPPKDILAKFAEATLPILSLIINSAKQSKQLASLRDWLLPMLMNGQVTINSTKEQ